MDDDVQLTIRMVAQRVGEVDKRIVHAHRGNRRTTVELARIEILTIGVLQLFANAMDGHALAVIDKQLRVAGGISTIGVE